MNEIKIFLASLSFFTRIPCHSNNENFIEDLNKASKYFPLIGWVVGLCGSLVYLLTNCVLPHNIAVFLSIITTIIITGAFHEDGFADFIDGFGGGYDKKRILEIMKDSRIGVYGVIGIILLLMLKYLCLIKINAAIFPLIIIAGNSISRFCSISFIYTHNYARENDDTSKSKPITNKMSLNNLLLAALFGILPVLLLGYKALLIIIPIFIVRQVFSHYFTKKINGYTGDCLGAVQQITEMIFYIFILLIPNFLSK